MSRKTFPAHFFMVMLQAKGTMAQPAERSKGYTLQSCSPFRNRKDRPHEFYVKKSGCGER